MGANFSNMLTPGQWLVLGLVPLAIVALYFLKLRRQPLEVPSTFLWHRTIEDLHVNSLWQRLRQSILLYLQLLLLGLIMLAVLRPHWKARSLVQDRFVFLIDTSASMSCTDVKPSRLAQAKDKVAGLLTQMKSGDAAMIVSFSDRARVEQPFTTNRRQLRRKLEAIEPTQRGTDISEALQAAAGLANPGRTSESAGDIQVADALPADVIIFSDGRFRNVPDFSWGNLKPIYVPLGQTDTANLGIVAFSALPNPGRPDQMQALALIENFGEFEVDLDVSLYLDDTLLDASHQTVAAGKTRGVEFAFDRVAGGALKLELNRTDDFLADNVAYAAINRPERARVLLVTPGNTALETALGTEDALRLADVAILPPSSLAGDEYQQRAASGYYDLVVYDQCAPARMPQANTLFVGAAPPTRSWSVGKAVTAPQIIDTDLSHPIMAYVDVGNVILATGTTVSGPPGCHVLLETDLGPMIAVAPREGFEDLVIGFDLVGTDEQGASYANTNWPIRLSFPLFCRNVLVYLGGVAAGEEMPSVRPGHSVALRTSVPHPAVIVTDPQDKTMTVPRGRDNFYRFHATDQIGLYHVRESDSDEVPRRFAVNLFDRVESDVVPTGSFATSWTEVEAAQGFETTRHELWRWIVLVAIGVLMLEWYVYNRRVYL